MKKTEQNMFFGRVNEFIDMLKTDLKSPKTISTYIESLNSFRKYLESALKKKVAKIVFDDVNEDRVRAYLKWISDSNASVNTRNLRLTTIRAYYSFCATKDISLVPEEIKIAKIKCKTVHPKKHNWLDKEQMKELLEVIPKNKKGIRDRFMIFFMFSTGVRLAELINLKAKDIVIDKVANYVRVTGKGNKQRVIPLTEECSKQYQVYFSLYHSRGKPDDYLFYTIIHGEIFPMSSDNVQRIVKKYGNLVKKKDANFPDLHPHMLRHTYGALMYRQGLSLPEVAKLMGHEQLSTTEIYAETDIDMIEEAIKKLGNPSLEYDFDNMSEEDQLKVLGLKN